jgi:hypothetical protein
MAIRSQDLSDEEIVRRGIEIYDQRLKPLLEPEHVGKFIAIAVEDGDYEIAETSLDADLALRQRHPDAVLYINRIGHLSAYEWVTPYWYADAGKS